MAESFVAILEVGGKANSLGRADEVTQAVLADQSRIEELYICLSDDNPWVRMRAIDSLEKICRLHPDWIEPYIDRLNQDFASSEQASIQWHIAQIYGEVILTDSQQDFAINWLQDRLSTSDVDWIVAANSMKTLAQFVNDGTVKSSALIPLLKVQQNHKSNAVKKRADKLLKFYQKATA